MKRNVVAFASGLLFAVGLVVAGMTRPSKVIAFLDFTGDWDPSLAFVILGALAVHVVVVRWTSTRSAPVLAPSFQIPPKREVDVALIAGAALFGVGWGLAGYCPGPAVASLTSAASSTIAFLVSMAAGMGVFAAVESVRAVGRKAANARPQEQRQ
jgi:uncharacterized membrane protein YedE/YeeE